MKYKPKPINTSKVELNKSLKNLQEELARNTHDIWAEGRLADGWTYGLKRDDTKKNNPCLIEYANLPESEKKYDRVIAAETLKSIIQMGYTIHEPITLKTVSIQPEIENLLNHLTIEPGMPIQELLSTWLGRNKQSWQKIPRLYLVIGEKFLRYGEALLAYDAFTEGLETFETLTYVKQAAKKLRPVYLRMLQLKALALAQCDVPEQALKILLSLRDQGFDDGETMGILARTYKDMAAKATKTGIRQTYFQKAFEIYFNAYKISGKKRKPEDTYYNGINAATLALLTGRVKQSCELAEKIKKICLRGIKVSEKNRRHISYWIYATLGETELLLGDINQSALWYSRAGDRAGKNLRDLSSMQNQAKMILEHFKLSPNTINHCFHIPSITVFSGHMIDLPQRNKASFPPELESAVRNQIAKKLNNLNTGIAYSSAACGSDIIFLEQVLKKGGEINIVLPFEKEHFIRESVSLASDKSWIKRFERVISKAAAVKVMGFYDPVSIRSNLEFCNLFMYGASLFRSRMIGTNLNALAVWDKKTGNQGGTASTVQHWKSMGQKFCQINPIELTTHKKPSRKQTAAVKRIKRPSSGVKHYTYLPLLFADIKGYSKLSEDQLVKFSTHYMKAIGKITDKHACDLLSKWTQGDGLFFVFKSLAAAVRLATDLRNTIAKTDWNKHGLPADLTARISLDAGPCYSYHNPVVDQMGFCGTYVIRAARMEPITPPGQIYASETFVALCQAMDIQDVRFNYAGQVVLPKNHGTIPAYHVDTNR